MNTSLLESKLPIALFDVNFQYADSFQKTLEYSNRYIQPNENGEIASFRSRFNMKHGSVSLAYTHLFSTGRFLFPRELGRD